MTALLSTGQQTLILILILVIVTTLIALAPTPPIPNANVMQIKALMILAPGGDEIARIDDFDMPEHHMIWCSGMSKSSTRAISSPPGAMIILAWYYIVHALHVLATTRFSIVHALHVLATTRFSRSSRRRIFFRSGDYLHFHDFDFHFVICVVWVTLAAL